ncbi:MAG: MATE family efflux transporter [Oscillospiraceae bacterium]|nr:MATE family efflux transporter [Oscillospiraceae bacterium]
MRLPLVHDRAFYKTFAALVGTLILEQAVVLSVNLADNVMIGSYSEVSLAGVAAVNQIQFVVQQLAFAISNALIVLASQYWGQRRTGPIRQAAAAALRYELAVALALFAAVSLFPRGCVGLFVEDAAIIGEGIRYLSIIRFTYPFFMVTTALLGAMRSVETVRLALGVSIVSLVVNCSINFVLISGRFGAPELGVQGAAIGTLTARVLEFVIVVAYVFLRDKKLGFRFRELLRVPGELRRDYTRVALPVLAQGAMWGVSNAVQTAILGHMDPTAMTAYSISSTIFLLLKVMAVGACTAASIIVGQQVGRGDRTALKSMVVTLQVLFLGIGAVLSAALLAIRLPLLSMYRISRETYDLASAFILIQCVVIFTMSYQMPTNAGIIRGGGDTRYGTILDLISIWCIVLPVSYLAAFVWNWPAIAVVMCLNADQVFKCVPAAIRANRYHWIKQLTR